jgi:hypothetical protein
MTAENTRVATGAAVAGERALGSLFGRLAGVDGDFQVAESNGESFLVPTGGIFGLGAALVGRLVTERCAVGGNRWSARRYREDGEHGQNAFERNCHSTLRNQFVE